MKGLGGFWLSVGSAKGVVVGSILRYGWAGSSIVVVGRSSR